MNHYSSVIMARDSLPFDAFIPEKIKYLTALALLASSFQF